MLTTTAGVVSYGSLKVSQYIIHSAVYIFLLVFEMREGILRNQKLNIGLVEWSGGSLNPPPPVAW